MGNIQGRIWKFGDHMDTDAIVSGRHLDAPIEEAAAHAFETVRPEFAREVKPGHLLVAGKNFGCGSSREQAATVLKQLGIKCVIAESFGRIFFRNSIAVGLPVVICANLSGAFNDGDVASVSFGNSIVTNVTTGKSLAAEPLSEDIVHILDKGGILEYLKDMMR